MVKWLTCWCFLLARCMKVLPQQSSPVWRLERTFEQVGWFRTRYREHLLLSPYGSQHLQIPHHIIHYTLLLIWSLRWVPLFFAQLPVFTIFVLEEERWPAALQLSSRHDGDAVAEQVGLVHEVRGEQDGAAALLSLKQVPGGASGWRIHSGCGLV